jgi:hypothetical protein
MTQLPGSPIYGLATADPPRGAFRLAALRRFARSGRPSGRPRWFAWLTRGLTPDSLG